MDTIDEASEIIASVLATHKDNDTLARTIALTLHDNYMLTSVKAFAIGDIDTETIVTQPHPRGSWNGDASNPYYFDVPAGTTMTRYTTDWEEVND